MYNFSEMKPEIHPETFIAEGARIVGRVILGRGSSVWYNCVLRADIATITIGEVARALSEKEIRHLTEHAGLYVSFWKAYAARGIGGFEPHPPVRRP